MDEELYQVVVAREETIKASHAVTVDRAFLRQHLPGITAIDLNSLRHPVYLNAGDSVTINFRRAYTHLDLETAVLLKMQYNGTLTAMEPEPKKGVWSKFRSRLTGR